MRTSISSAAILTTLAALLAAAASATGAEAAVSARYLVEASTSAAAHKLVERVGGKVEQDLEIIHGVSAQLDAQQAAALRASAGVRVYADRSPTTAAKKTASGTAPAKTSTTTTEPTTSGAGSLAAAVTSLVAASSGSTVLADGSGVSNFTLTYQTDYPAEVGADTLQKAGITGQGVTIAVLDTGLWQDFLQNYSSRILATRDVLNGGTGSVSGDPYGHGTHITSIAAGGAMNIAGGYLGIAPQANLVIVRAFDESGAGSYADVIAGLNWIVANRKTYNIRVLNLSFGAPPQSDYWDDPLNQAVMAAWKAGIVVVTAAGNEGPSPMTIGVPGNVPYVITAGALTDNSTPYDGTDDRLASFSSTGPTFEGFVKPEVVAPGGHMVGSQQSTSYLANIDPGSMTMYQTLFTMSGTSQAAAVTTGVVALMLQSDPTLTPDNVKCRLMAAARPAITSTGTLAYSVFQQGAGLINAVAAVNSAATGCANVGLDIAADLAGTAHFGGPANQDANGDYYVMDLGASIWGTPLTGDGFTWSRGYTWSKGYTWSQGYTWSKGFTWSKGYTWSKATTWSSGFTWSKGYTWSKVLPWWGTTGTGLTATKPASIVNWVPNQ